MKHIIRPLMVGVAMAAACILPAAAQESTPIPPETTEIPIPPEATALPEGVVFAAPGFCLISPDETNVAVWHDAVYDLPSGAKRFDLPEVDWVHHSADGRYLFISESGMHDAQTGELLIASNGLYLPGVAEVSPDRNLLVEGNNVYDLTTLEQIATIDRNGPNYGEALPSYGQIEFVNEGRWLAFDRFDTEHENWVKVYVDVETWETILDGGDYPPGMGLRFSGDFTHYAVGGEGVFSYPAGEKLFDLPRGQVEFSEDSSVIMITTYPTTTTSNEPVLFTYVNAASGEQINRFEVPVLAYIQLLSRGLVSEPTLTRAVMPVITEVGVGENMTPLIRTWQVVEVATGEVLHELERVVEVLEFEDVNILREALGLPRSDQQFAGGRYVIWGEGIFDVETDALIFAREGSPFSLSPLGTYAYVGNPCMLWELP
ncbi:MAG: hypothetical protein MUF38_13255 [Anaerolineae bacterium]|nr:hypothetical protein [Anaerolineae bacterium]